MTTPDFSPLGDGWEVYGHRAVMERVMIQYNSELSHYTAMMETPAGLIAATAPTPTNALVGLHRQLFNLIDTQARHITELSSRRTLDELLSEPPTEKLFVWKQHDYSVWGAVIYLGSPTTAMKHILSATLLCNGDCGGGTHGSDWTLIFMSREYGPDKFSNLQELADKLATEFMANNGWVRRTK